VNVKIKVSGNQAAVEQFLKELDKNFALMLKSKLLANEHDLGVHCFIDLDPCAVRKEAEQQ
jgi:hypothetical protein